MSHHDLLHLAFKGGLGDGGRGLGVVLPKDGAHRHDEAARLVRDGQPHPLLTEVDPQDTHEQGG